MTKQIQSMPEIWNSGEFLISKNDIIGALACWAVKQSPYPMPTNLQEGLLEFAEQFDPCPAFNPIDSEYFETDCPTLLGAIRYTFESCPTIMGWRRVKKGNSHCSRYYDYTDLDALARNVAHLITLEAKYQKLHN